MHDVDLFSKKSAAPLCRQSPLPKAGVDLHSCNNDLAVARFGFNIILLVSSCACRQWGGQGLGGHPPGVGVLEVPVTFRVGG